MVRALLWLAGGFWLLFAVMLLIAPVELLPRAAGLALVVSLPGLAFLLWAGVARQRRDHEEST
jgi:hypothetical protein